MKLSLLKAVRRKNNISPDFDCIFDEFANYGSVGIVVERFYPTVETTGFPNAGIKRHERLVEISP